MLSECPTRRQFISSFFLFPAQQLFLKKTINENFYFFAFYSKNNVKPLAFSFCSYFCLVAHIFKKNATFVHTKKYNRQNR